MIASVLVLIAAGQLEPDAGVATPFVPTMRVGQFTIGPTLSLETDARLHSNEAEGENGFVLRRLRVGVHLTAGSWAEVVGRIEYLPEADQHVGVFDAYLELAPWADWRFSAGYRKTPLFASARDEPIEGLAVPELALPVRAFWPGRDLGVEVHRLPTQRVPIEAFLRFGNGSGSAAGNDDARPVVEGRVDVVLGSLSREPTGDASAFRGGFGAHFENANIDRAGLSPTTASGFLFWRPPNVYGTRVIGEGHAAAWFKRWAFRLEGAVASEDRSRETDGNPATPREAQKSVLSWGAFAEVSYMLFGTPRRAGDWPNSVPDLLDWRSGGLELAGRIEWLQMGLRAAPEVEASGAHGGSIAARWWVTRWLSASLAAFYLAYDRPPLEEPDQKSAWLLMARLSVVIF